MSDYQTPSFGFFNDDYDNNDDDDDDSELFHSEDLELNDPNLLTVSRELVDDHFRALCSKVIFRRTDESLDIMLDYHLECYWYQRHFVLPELQQAVNADLNSRFFIWLAAEASFYQPDDESETCTRWSSYRLALFRIEMSLDAKRVANRYAYIFHVFFPSTETDHGF